MVGDHLTQLSDLIGRVQRTRTIMVQNLVLSGITIAALVPSAADGLLGLGKNCRNSDRGAVRSATTREPGWSRDRWEQVDR